MKNIEHIDSCTQTEWRDSNGYLHKVDGPAIIRKNGTTEWINHGWLHRKGGPARTRANGDQEWWTHGQLHRTDGPAVEESNGHKEWWIYGRQLDQLEFWILTNK